MKKIYVYVLLMCFALGSSQNPADIDPTFNSSLNTQKLDCTWSTNSRAVLILPNGKILVAAPYYNGEFAPGITQLNSNGTRDEDFITNFSNTMQVCTIGRQSSGKIIVGGKFTEYLNNFSDPYKRIGRYNADGTRDNTFQMGTGFNNTVRKVIVLPNDKILVFGDFTTYQDIDAKGIVRLNADGSRDNTFTVGTGFNGIVYDAVLQPDGKIIAAGQFENVQGSVRRKIARLNTDGTLDTSLPMVDISGTLGITSVSLQPDGKILLRGDFPEIAGNTKNGIARLNSDGTVDNNFLTGTGMIEPLFQGIQGGTISTTPDGKVLVSTIYYNGAAVNGYIKLDLDGNVDTTFNAGFGSQSSLGDDFAKWAFDANGKIIIGHMGDDFDRYYSSGYACLNPNGSVDHSFNVGKGFKGEVLILAKQPDGKIIAGGKFDNYNGSIVKRLARLNADGSDDQQFNIGAGFNYEVNDIKLQTDGKILIAGRFSQFNGYSCLGIVRLNADGSRDTTFNLGVPLTPYGTSDAVFISRILLQSDGKIILAGNFKYTFQSVVRNMLVRLNANGTFDPTFIVASDFASGSNYPLALQSDGKILVSSYSYGGTIAPGLHRLNPNGTRDDSFNVGSGFSSTGNGSITTIVVLASGKIIVGGIFDHYNANVVDNLVRLNADGSRDTSFTLTGYNPSFFSLVALAEQSDGKIILSGAFMQASNSTTDRFIRLNLNGSKDATFNSPISTDTETSTYSYVHASTIVVEQGGTLLLGGNFYTLETSIVNHIGRIFADGSVDISFNSASGYDAVVNAITTTNDNKIFTGGSYNSYNGSDAKQASRLLNNGNADPTFNSLGTGFNAGIKALALQADAKLIAVGEFTIYNGTTVNRITRLNSNGTLDALFNTGTGFNNTVNAVAIQTDGKIVAVGEFTTYNGTAVNRIARLNSDGTLDTSFISGNGLNGTAYAILLQPDAKILIGGSFTAYNGNTCNGLVRIDTAAVFDPNFMLGSGFNQMILALALQTDGKIIAGGDFTAFNGTTANRILRLNGNGSGDGSFISGGGFEAAVNAILIQQDGKILAGGSFDHYNGTTAQKLACLFTNGTIDTGFNTTDGFNGAVNTLKLQSNGNILVGGAFTTFKGQVVNRFARLNGTSIMLNSEKPVLVSPTVLIYPNPVETFLNLKTNASQVKKYEIYNLDGKLVEGRILNIDEPINVSNLSKGMYIIYLKTDQGSCSEKFIKK